jgi:toxin ParE1/3/4
MPKSKPYRFHPQAWSELEAADDWYRERSAESGIRFLSAVYDGLERIAVAPLRWPRHFHGTRRLILHRFPFSIIYRDEPSADSVSVVAIAHHKRKPGYWKIRM